MEEQKTMSLIILKQGWIASTWSDFQTFGIMCAAYGVNSLYFGNNGWLNFTITLAFIAWVLAKVTLKSIKTEKLQVLNTDSKEEAIAFIQAA